MDRRVRFLINILDVRRAKGRGAGKKATMIMIRPLGHLNPIILMVAMAPGNALLVDNIAKRCRSLSGEMIDQ
jgi:hypothetical protein